MTKIIYSLDYQCLPIWVCENNDTLICNGLTSELQNELGTEILAKINELSIRYDSLFRNDEKCFEYKGFQNNKQRSDFIKESIELMEKIKSKVDNEVIIEIRTDLSKL